jgi:cell division protein FtsW
MITDTKKMDWSRTDFSLLTSILVLIIIGAASIYSASSYRSDIRYGNSEYFFIKQLTRAVIGLVLMVLIAKKDYRHWLNKSFKFYLICLGLLAILLMHLPFVTRQNGADSWINLYFFTLQPSDLARYAMIMLLAKKLYDWRDELDEPSTYARLFGLAMLVVAPVALQHDMGTAALTIIIAFSLFFFAEIRTSYIAITGMAAMSLGMIYMSINAYMLHRVGGFMSSFLGGVMPHQLKQSIIALAQGGLLGQGIGDSRQKYLFLPEAHNDFIFAMIGEEYGLIGTLGVLLLFLVIIHRGMIIAKQAPDLPGRYLAAGITACYASYALINAGVVVGLLPTTGIPMPFLSYGGTSLVTHLAALGLLLNISAQASPAYAQSPGWREYKQRVEERTFPSPASMLPHRGPVRRTVSLRTKVQ